MVKSICLAAMVLAAAAFASAQPAPLGGQRPMVRAPAPPPPPPTPVSNTGPACSASNRLGNECVSNPIFTTYLGAAMQCSGHVLSLTEMYAFKRAHPEAKGIECTSDWNAATGTIYCVDEKGYVSGSGIQNQAEGLGKNPLLFRGLLH